MNATTPSASDISSAILTNISELSYFINLYSGIINITGIFFDFIAAFVFVRSIFTKTTMGFYYTMLSMLHCYVLAINSIIYFPSTWDIDMYVISDFLCRLFKFLRRFSPQLSSWFQVFITLDRTLNAVYPRRFRFLNKRRNLLKVTLGMACVLAIINAPDLFYTLKTKVSGNKTSLSCSATSGISIYDSFANIIFRTLLPFFLMLIMNVKLLWVLIKTRRHINHSASLRKEAHFAFTITTNNFLFIALNLPYAIVSPIYHVYKQNVATIDHITFAYADIITTFAACFSFYYEAIYFFTSFIFNRIFRKELINMCSTLLTWPRRSIEAHKEHALRHEHRGKVERSFSANGT